MRKFDFKFVKSDFLQFQFQFVNINSVFKFVKFVKDKGLHRSIRRDTLEADTLEGGHKSRKKED